MSGVGIPHTSHRGFFDKAYNSVRRVGKLSGDYEYGHLQLLKTMGCHGDAEHVERLTEEFNVPSMVHYCLPDNLSSFVSKQECIDWGDKGEWTRWPSQKFTVSFRHPSGHDLLLFFFVDAVDNLGPCVMWLQSLNEHCGITKALPKEAQAAARKLWVAPSFAFKVFPEYTEARNWMIERRAIDESFRESQTAHDSVQMAFDAIMYFLTLMNRPDQLHEAYPEPEFTPRKMNKGKKKRGFISDKQPTFFRIYKPHVRTVYPEGHVPTPSGVKQRQHTRRGHLRRYKDGRTIWIDDYTAGDPELGKLRPKTVEVMPARLKK